MHPSIKHTCIHIGTIGFVVLTGLFLGQLAMRAGLSSPSANELLSSSGSSATDGTLSTSGFTVADLTPPTPPTLSVDTIGSGSVAISWTPSSDNISVSGYRIFRNGALLAGMTGTSYIDSSSMQPGMSYAYYVVAMDPTGNMSLPSNAVVATLPTTAGGMNTFSSTTSGPGSSTGVTQVALQDVSYAVLQASDAAFCDGNVRKTPVGFITTPITGGYFRVTYPNGQVMDIEPGHLPLENGTYHWQGMDRSGYNAVGPTGGDFSLTGSCANLTTINPYTTTSGEDATDGAVTATPVTSTTPPPATPTTTKLTAVENKNGLVTTIASSTKQIPTLDDVITMRVYSENKLVAQNGEVDGEVELRVVAQNADAVSFVAEVSGVKRTLGKADLDQFLSRPNEDVWSYFWKTTSMPNNTYKIIAMLSDDKGKVTQSIPMTVVVNNRPPRTSAAQDPSSTSVLSKVTVITTDADRDNILTRVIAPSVCATPQECRVFCQSSQERSEQCDAFVSTKIVASTVVIAASTTGTTTPVASGDIKHNELPQEITERTGARQFVDTDDDGVSNYDEINIYHTNPNAADSDGDGVTDGNELIAGTNPSGNRLASSTVVNEDVNLEDPKVSGVVKPELLAVNDIAVVSTSTDSEGKIHSDKIEFSGHALPNAFVTLFIFSEPIVVTVKTDASGAWTYILDKELPDGSHQVITAITDGGGKILAKSEPLPFVKQAAAVSVGNELVIPKTADTPGFFSTPSLIALIALIVGVLGIAVSIIGFTVHHEHDAKQHLTL